MKTRGIIVASAAVTLLTLLVTFSVSGAQGPSSLSLFDALHLPIPKQMTLPPQPQRAPLRPEVRGPLLPGTGLIRPPMDLSHLTGQMMPQNAVATTLPDQFDWRDRGGQNYVSPVEDQNPCGSCYTFGFLGSFESRLLIDGAGMYNFSQNHAKECNWRELNDFQYPNPGDYWGSCDGGNAFMLASLFSQSGTVLETCDPHVPSDVDCTGTCPYQKTLLDWRLISGSSVPDTQILKQYLYDHGPIITSMDANAGEGFNGSYEGSYTFDYTTPGDAINHCVLLVGWSDSLPPVPGGAGPAEGWIVRNSWGTGWGDNGYFYITYGAANIGSASSFVHDWQDYDPSGDVWYYDDDGWWSSWGYGAPTGWGLARFTPDTSTNVTRVEFWTTDVTTDVDVYVYDDFDGNTLSSKLAEALNNAYGEAGYHSVELSSPVPVTAGDDVIAVVKFTNRGYGYPIPTDPHGAIETGRTYMSASGSSWMDMGTTHSTDVAIRLRTSLEAPQAPSLMDITPSSGVNTGVVNITQLSGSNFQSGATVKLIKPGQKDIDAANVSVVNASKITCDFDLTGAATGSWHVVVTNPDDRSGTLSNGFWVSAPGSHEHAVYLPMLFRTYPPVPQTPALRPIDNPDGNGDYEVRWDPADRANTYTLQESNNAGLLNPTSYPPTANTHKAFSGKTPGTYYYRVRASNAWGDSGWSNVQTVDVSLKARFGSTADASLIQGWPAVNDGGDYAMWVGYDHCQDAEVTRGLIKFDLSSIPTGTGISQARLYVFLEGSCDSANRTHTVKAYRVKNSWSESAITWHSRPSHGEEYGSASVKSRDWGWYSFNVTGLVRGWVDGSFSNRGLMFRGPESSGNSSARLSFLTREAGDAYAPYLDIAYTDITVSQEVVPVAASNAVPTICGSTVKDTVAGAPMLFEPTGFGFTEHTACSSD